MTGLSCQHLHTDNHSMAACADFVIVAAVKQAYVLISIHTVNMSKLLCPDRQYIVHYTHD